MRDRLNAVQRYKYCLVWSWPSSELEISFMMQLFCNSLKIVASSNSSMSSTAMVAKVMTCSEWYQRYHNFYNFHQFLISKSLILQFWEWVTTSRLHFESYLIFMDFEILITEKNDLNTYHLNKVHDNLSSFIPVRRTLTIDPDRYSKIPVYHRNLLNWNPSKLLRSKIEITFSPFWYFLMNLTFTDWPPDLYTKI